MSSTSPLNSLLTIDSLFQNSGASPVMTFLHLCHQEYLGAYHIASLTAEEQVEIIKKYGNCEHVDNTWTFYCGMIAHHEEGISLFEQLMSNSKSSHFLKAECAYESQKLNFCTKLAEVESGILKFHYKQFSPGDFNIISFVMKSSFISSLTFVNCSTFYSKFNCISIWKKYQEKSVPLLQLLDELRINNPKFMDEAISRGKSLFSQYNEFIPEEVSTLITSAQDEVLDLVKKEGYVSAHSKCQTIAEQFYSH